MRMSGAFQALSMYVSVKCVLFIDDVETRIATLEACAFALIEAGATKVFALTLARANSNVV
jgi:predicted amidophosphoribosyltransferase